MIVILIIRSPVVRCQFDHVEPFAGAAEITVKLEVVQEIIIYFCVVFSVARVAQIDSSIAYFPEEVQADAAVWSHSIEVHLISVAISGIFVIGVEYQIGGI